MYSWKIYPHQWRYDIGQSYSQIAWENSPTLVFSGVGILCCANENLFLPLSCPVLARWTVLDERWLLTGFFKDKPFGKIPSDLLLVRNIMFLMGLANSHNKVSQLQIIQQNVLKSSVSNSAKHRIFTAVECSFKNIFNKQKALHLLAQPVWTWYTPFL
jgi:hypothetical protein